MDETRMTSDPPSEGDLYRRIEIEGVTLDVYYGYYHPASERGVLDPMPVFPNFAETPVYTEAGYPLVGADQPVCQHFSPKPRISDEGWCNDCAHLELYDTCLGVCRCPRNRKRE